MTTAGTFVDVKEFIDPKTIEIDGQTFIVSRLPAFDAASVYDAIIEHQGIIPQSEKLALLSRCAIVTDKGNIVLSMPSLVNTNIAKFQTLHKLIDEAFKLNFSFSGDGNHSQE